MQDENKINIETENKLHPSYRPHYRCDDLKYFIRDFVEQQKVWLEIERQEEETQSLNNISMFNAKVIKSIFFIDVCSLSSIVFKLSLLKCITN